MFVVSTIQTDSIPFVRLNKICVREMEYGWSLNKRLKPRMVHYLPWFQQMKRYFLDLIMNFSVQLRYILTITSTAMDEMHWDAPIYVDKPANAKLRLDMPNMEKKLRERNAEAEQPREWAGPRAKNYYYVKYFWIKFVYFNHSHKKSCLHLFFLL